jgi:hypothetical protein
MSETPKPKFVTGTIVGNAVEPIADPTAPLEGQSETPNAEQLKWAIAVAEQDAEPDVIGTAAHILLKRIRQLERELAASKQKWRDLGFCEDCGMYVVSKPLPKPNARGEAPPEAVASSALLGHAWGD